MENKNVTQVKSGGIGFLGLLSILFIGLKLGNVITWPWIWVLTPLWGGFALIALVLIIAIIFAISYEVLK